MEQNFRRMDDFAESSKVVKNCISILTKLLSHFYMLAKKILFYAPLGKDTPPEKIGGAESGCLKTKAIYEEAGYEVIVINKPAMSRGKFRFMIEMVILPLNLLVVIKKMGKNCPLHIVGFYTKIAVYERLLMNIAHLCGNKVIYELRNGSMVTTYKEGSPKYRKILKDLLLKPEVVLCQGKEYVDFIKETWGVERSYYPNYIMDDFIQPNNLNRGKLIKLLYFGRVTESKKVDLIIETLCLVRDAGIDATLDIIGGYSDEYKKYLDAIVNKSGLSEYVIFHDRKPFGFIVEKLRTSHYFVFPSAEKQEGHSNSLTEAMGCGVVPIVSTAGFNVSICGNKDLVVENLKADLFAQRIIEIERDKKWREYSEFVYNRTLNNFTQNIVGKNLINFIRPLWQE